MDRISLAELNRAVYERLSTDVCIISLCPNIYNHIPQEAVFPQIRYRHNYNTEWDTKDSFGYDSQIIVDIFTNYRGDKLVAEIADAVIDAFDLKPFVLSKGQSLYLRHDLVDYNVEPDGLTHHGILRFHHISTT